MILLLTYLIVFIFSTNALNTPPVPSPRIDRTGTPRVCQKTKVAVLGAGIAGITAAQTLSNNSIEDFIILEYNGEIGGRCRDTGFGKDINGNPYTVELGANWVQGTQSNGGPENPIWALAKKYNIRNYPTDTSSLVTYNETGQVDFSDKLLDFQSTYWKVERDIGERLNAEIGDQKVLNSVQTKDVDLRSAFSAAGYSGEQDPQARTIEWWQMDYEYAQTPEVSSRDMTMASHDSTFGGFSDRSHLSIDPRGFNTFIKGLASEYLAPNDDRLLLNRVVDRVTWNDQNVTIDNTDGTCIEAEYAITTFSLGVLQSSAVTFSPPLPDSKHSAIQRFQMGTYTKIFLQFPPDQVFWNRSVELFLYASPTQRGYYPVFQSLDHDSFLSGSGILFVTVVTDQSYIVESQSDETTKQQVLQVLREMFGTDAVPDPIDFMYPRWSSMPWAYGSFSNWPPGFTIEDHDDLRGNMGRVWFAGEATSRKYYGYLHGAYFEGRDVGQAVAECVLDPRASHCIQTNLNSI